MLLVDDADEDGLLARQRDDGEVNGDNAVEGMAEDKVREVREAHLGAELELASWSSGETRSRSLAESAWM